MLAPAPTGRGPNSRRSKDDSHWSVVSFFEDEEAARAAEARWEQMGGEIPESTRGKRVGLETYEVGFDVEMMR
jgi:hypothetical protein